MKLLLLLPALLSLSLFAGCDTPEDCGNPFGCTEEKINRLTSSELGELIGVAEPSAAILLDDQGHVPAFSETGDELFYTLSSEEIATLASAANE